MRFPSRLGLWPALLTLGTACATHRAQPPFAPPPAIDGETADWNAVPVLITDPTDAPGTELDLLEVRARDDGRHFDLLPVVVDFRWK